jgi:hypothetical protein
MKAKKIFVEIHYEMNQTVKIIIEDDNKFINEIAGEIETACQKERE